MSRYPVPLPTCLLSDQPSPGVHQAHNPSFPPDTEEKQKQLGEFFGTYPPPKVAGQVPAFVDAIKAQDSSLKSFGIVGYCWGGKVISLAVKAESNPFSIAAAVHPAMVDPADAEGIKIPFSLIASKDEPVEDVEKFEANLTAAKHVEIFKDQIHGFMAARSNLEDPRVKEEYERGYKVLVDFFCHNF